MILDRIENAAKYFRGDRVEQALRILRNYRMEDFTGLCRVIDGEKLYFNHANYETKEGEGLMEVHRKYVDVMYMMEGTEVIYYKNADKLETVTREYRDEDDAMLGKVDADAAKIVLHPGDIVIFFPGDAHCPGNAYGAPERIKKVIAKAAV